MGDRNYTAADLEKTRPNMVLDKETIESFSKEFDVLPLFERKHHNYVFTKHYSLRSNHFLQRRWKEFLKTLEGRERVPFEFPSHEDFHFYLHHNCYVPSQSVNRRSHYRHQMRTGPGVDQIGQIPVPDDMNIRKIGSAKIINAKCKVAKNKQSSKKL